MQNFLRIILLVSLLIPLSAFGASSSIVTFTFKVKTGVDVINGISKDGKVYAGLKSGNKVVVKIPKSKLGGLSFFALNEGRLIGPVFYKNGSQTLLVTSSKVTNARKQELKKVSLSLKTVDSSKPYVLLATTSDLIFDKKFKYNPSSTSALGLNVPKDSLSKKVTTRAVPSSDTDGDGVVNSLDADGDGDGILNIADNDSARDIPYSALYLDMASTINWHINGALDATTINSVIGGENKFSLAFYFTFAPNNVGTITGGHVVCSDSLTYCNSTSGTAVYSGFSDGDRSLPGNLWRTMTTDGSPNGLETMNSRGGGGLTLAAAIQPRVGPSEFRPGDTYRVDFTNAGGSVVESRPLTLPPYFVSVPALRGYRSTSAGDLTTIDYAGGSTTGSNTSNPIVLATDGDFVGKLHLQIYRLQRAGVQPTESSDYLDFGRLNYGVIIDNNAGEYTCGGLYSNLSSSLSELPSTGSSGGFVSHEGALLWPLVDSRDDYVPGTAESAIADNTISFTIDLKSCLARNGLPAGIYNVNLIAAGADTGHGANRAGQRFAVNIP